MTISLIRLVAAFSSLLTFGLGVCGAQSVEKRIALVIGNGAYQNATPLPNPPSDARLMASTLRELGFSVIEGIDLDKVGLDAKTREFAKALTTADTAVLFYAGHGIQVSGRNYLLPVDAKLDSERDLQFEAVAADVILGQMELEREDKTNIVFLDACRDNPLARNLMRSMGTRSAALGRGLAQVQSGVGSFISFSTQPGNVALDGAEQNSPFAAALAARIKTPGKSLSGVMIDVRRDVLKSTGGKQVPWDHSALTGEFYFVPGADVVAAAPSAPSNATEVAALTNRMKQLEEQLKQRSEEKPVALSPAAAPEGRPDQRRPRDEPTDRRRARDEVAALPAAPSNAEVVELRQGQAIMTKQQINLAFPSSQSRYDRNTGLLRGDTFVMTLNGRTQTARAGSHFDLGRMAGARDLSPEARSCVIDVTDLVQSPGTPARAIFRIACR